MDQEMKDNLQDLRDIRKQMDQYYGIGQEYIRKEQIFERYEKAKKKWDLENKKKYMIISVVAGVLFGFPGLMLGVLVAAGIYFFYDKISAEKQSLCDEKEDEFNAILKRYQEKYTPVAEKCERLLLNKDEYAVPMSVDYLIQMIETGRVNTMNEAYDKLDEQLHRWTMEKLQKQQLDVQLEQSRQLKEISAWQKVQVSMEFGKFINRI